MFYGYSGPKHMCVRFQAGATPPELKCQFMRKIHDDWFGSHSWISTPTSPFSTKTIPILEEIRAILWLVWPKIHVCVWFQTGAAPLELQYQFIRKVYDDWFRHHSWISTPTLPFSTKPIPVFVKIGPILWLVWPKTHVCVVLDWYYTA